MDRHPVGGSEQRRVYVQRGRMVWWSELGENAGAGLVVMRIDFESTAKSEGPQYSRSTRGGVRGRAAWGVAGNPVIRSRDPWSKANPARGQNFCFRPGRQTVPWRANGYVASRKAAKLTEVVQS